MFNETIDQRQLINSNATANCEIIKLKSQLSYTEILQELEQKIQHLTANKQQRAYNKFKPQLTDTAYYKLESACIQTVVTANWITFLTDIHMFASRSQRYNNKLEAELEKKSMSVFSKTINPYFILMFALPSLVNLIVIPAAVDNQNVIFPRETLSISKLLNINSNIKSNLIIHFLIGMICFLALFMNENSARFSAVISSMHANTVNNGTYIPGKSDFTNEGATLGWILLSILLTIQLRTQYITTGLLQKTWCKIACLDKHFDAILDSANGLNGVPEHYNKLNFSQQCPLFTRQDVANNDNFYADDQLNPNNTLLLKIKEIGVYVLQKNWALYCLANIDDNLQVPSPFNSNQMITVGLDQFQQTAPQIINLTCPVSNKNINELEQIVITPQGFIFSANGNRSENILKKLCHTQACPVTGHELRHSQLTFLVTKQVRAIYNNFTLQQNTASDTNVTCIEIDTSASKVHNSF